MKMIRKTGLVILVFLSICMALLLFWRTDIPAGRQGKAAESMTYSVQAAMGQEAWDSIKWIGWSVNGQRHYVWNRTEDLAIIRFGAYRVHLNLNSKIGSAWKNGKLLEGPKRDKAIMKAWSKWVYDSFLLNPVARTRGEGTVRKLIRNKGADDALLVQYTTGGIMPGDNFLYALDDQNLPDHIRMWVRKLPVGGLKMTFEQYRTIENGIRLPGAYRIGPLRIRIDSIQAGSSFTSLGFDRDPFIFVE